MPKPDIRMQKSRVKTKPNRAYTPLNQSYEERQKWYLSSRWQQFREAYLKENGHCVTCLNKGAVMPAEIVDHVDGHDPLTWKETFWDGGVGGFQALCWSCHSRKTTLEDQKKKVPRLSPSQRAALVLSKRKG